MFLSEEEIERLTGKQRHDAQARQLEHLGIDHGIRADGSIVVLEEHIRKTFGGLDTKPVRVKMPEPNWADI